MGVSKKVLCSQISHMTTGAFISLENVEIIDGRVTICRDANKGKCTRPNCKYYHKSPSSTTWVKVKNTQEQYMDRGW